MRILITGKGGKSGSWQIRGIQLGGAIGAHVKPMAGIDDIRRADVVVVVKRTPSTVIEAIRQSGKPWIYDIVDGWPQPSRWQGKEAIAWLRTTLKKLRPDGVVFGTHRMQEDAGFDGPSLMLPHHSWQKYLDRQPVIREQLQTVGYEGSTKFLGRWQSILETECRNRNWEFVINGDMTQVDIGVCLRDNGGYPARWWKPGTKLSNLQALAIPALCNYEAGYESVSCGEEFWITSAEHLRQSLNMLLPQNERLRISKKMRAAALTLESLSDQYSLWIKKIAQGSI